MNGTKRMGAWPVIHSWARSVPTDAPQTELVLCQLHDAAAFRGLVGEGGQLRRLRQLRDASMPSTGRNSTACRLPRVMVPVLSSSSTSTSPAASTARPDMAMTLRWISRSMPAMPMAGSRPPMVVGIRQTSRATSTVMVTGLPVSAGQDAVDGEREQRGARPPGRRW